LLLRLLLILALVPVGWAAGTARAADPPGEGSIFRRFLQEREVPPSRQAMVEFPVAAAPQAERDAEILVNTGLTYVVSAHPKDRVYLSQSWGFARTAWRETGGSVGKVQVITLDISQVLNVSLWRKAVFSFGLGVGLMDGEIHYRDSRGLDTRLEPYIPVQVGLGLPVGRSFYGGLKVVQSSFFGPGPVVSLTRVLLGLGVNY